ncbi:MAG: ABC transporter ATP-binding protein [Candidatus Micrarchaeota archaeon]
MPNHILKVKNLCKHYDGVVALDNCSFEIEVGTITGLIGPNGAGKTTLFNVISGFEKPTSGSVYLHNQNVTNLKSHEVASLGLCRTFQSTKLFSHMTAMENLITAQKTSNNYIDIAKDLFRDQTIIAKKSLDILSWANLHEKKNHLTKDLSYGQQKILAPLRSLAADPKVLLLDEPFAGVNPKMVKSIMENIVKIKNTGKTILLIEHNLSAVMDLCEGVIVLDQGKKIAHGSIDEIKNNKKVIEAYLGAV